MAVGQRPTCSKMPHRWQSWQRKRCFYSWKIKLSNGDTNCFACCAGHFFIHHFLTQLFTNYRLSNPWWCKPQLHTHHTRVCFGTHQSATVVFTLTHPHCTWTKYSTGPALYMTCFFLMQEDNCDTTCKHICSSPKYFVCSAYSVLKIIFGV